MEGMGRLFDERLNEMLLRHGVELVDEHKMNDNLELSVKGILTEYCAGKKCALWGAGRMNTTSSHTAVLIGKYATYLQNLVCVIDSDPDFQGKSFLGYPIIAPEQIKDYNPEIIVISSKNSAKSIIDSLLEVSPASRYVDIYGELSRRGLEVYNNFFDERSIYTQIFDLQQNLKSEDRDFEKAGILHKIISYYLGIRDFYYAFFYMDLYIREGYEGYKEYILLKAEINELLKEIISINAGRTQDISMFYVDALRQMDVIDSQSGSPRVLKKYIDSADIYTNVYSTGATTYESMVSAILGKYPLECNVYSQNFLRSVDEFKAVKQIYDLGYRINWMVSDAYRLLEDDYRLHFDIQIYMSRKLWNLACSLAEAKYKDKIFSFIYFPYEIHCPMLCGFHEIKPVIRGFSNMGIEDFPDSIAVQYQECVDYMDRQFDFYYELLGTGTTKVIFSDHSQVVYRKDNGTKTYNMYYKDKELVAHIPLIISRKGKEYKAYDGLLSLVDLNDIILSIVEDKDLTGLMKQVIRYQYYPIHSAKIRLHAQQWGYDDYIDGMDIFASEDYIYIKTGTGREEVYRHEDLDTSLLDTTEGRIFIDIVRKIYNVAF